MPRLLIPHLNYPLIAVLLASVLVWSGIALAAIAAAHAIGGL